MWGGGLEVEGGLGEGRNGNKMQQPVSIFVFDGKIPSMGVVLL